MNYAEFWRRFAAFLIDAILLGIIQAPINAMLGPTTQVVQQGTELTVTTRGGVSGLAVLLSLVISVLYWVVLQQKMGGQTLGKKALKIKVVDASGKVPSMLSFVLREIIGKLVSALILFIGYLMVIWDSKKQGLHDKIASTYVIKA